MLIHSVTHTGLVRKNNEDRFFTKEYENGAVLLVIADGMGGHAAGERAAQIAVDCMAECDPDSQAIETHLVDLVETASRRIAEASASNPSIRGMGTTLTGGFVRDGIAHWVHVGDTRLYLFREGRLTRITDDHTIPGRLLKAGELSEEGARVHPLKNMLLKCLGCENAEPDTGSFEVGRGDLLMLSSDGLHDTVSQEAISASLGSSSSLEDGLNALVLAALTSGGKDNITVVAATI